METATETGTVVRWVLARGFGFASVGDGQDIFVHHQNFADPSVAADGVPLGSRIEFRRGIDRSGRDRAEDVRIIEGR